jgi:uncharacterized FlaG/YvyC family protein
LTTKPLPFSQAHWQVTQADTRPKPAKELAYPQRTTDRRNQSKLKEKMTEINKHQQPINRNMSGTQYPVPSTRD